MNDADEWINWGTDIRRTSESRLIRKFEFESGSLLFQILATFALSITDRTSLIISKVQNV